MLGNDCSHKRTPISFNETMPQDKPSKLTSHQLVVLGNGFDLECGLPTRLLAEYGRTLDNEDHGKNLMHKLMIEGRLEVRLLRDEEQNAPSRRRYAK